MPSLQDLYKELSRVDAVDFVEDEITEDFIRHLLEKSLAQGLIIIGEHPDIPQKIIGVIYAFAVDHKRSAHVLTHLSLIVHPKFQGKKIGRTMLTIFLEEIARNYSHIGKVELLVRESNQIAITLFQSMGFLIEGRLEMRAKTKDGFYEADIPIGWQNPNYEF